MSGLIELVEMALDADDVPRATTARSPLIALPPETGLPERWAARFPAASFLYHDYAAWRSDRAAARHGAAGAALCFAAGCEATGRRHDLAVLFLPKGRQRIAFVLASVGAALERAAPALVVGANDSGIKSSRAAITGLIGPVGGVRVARHARLFAATAAAARPDDAPAPVAERFEVSALGRRLAVVALPGVFAGARLDDGTRLLLDHLGAELPAARVLDWGCGTGVIGAAIQLAVPEAKVELVDADVMAIEATARTLAANGLPSDRVRPSDGLSDAPGPYDLIVANPPFHAGLKTDLGAAARFLAEAADRLSPAGRLVLVANRFLGYPEILRRLFATVEVPVETSRYRVLRASAPLRRPTSAAP